MNTSKKALEHIIWRFENSIKTNKPINPSENDLKAINKLSEFYTHKKTENINNNTLFAKLYVVFYGELLKYFDSTVFSNIPQTELHKELDKPWQRIVNEFIDKHQLIEMGLQISKEHRDKHPKELKRLGIKVKEVDKMDYQETEDNLKSLINLALNQYE